MKKRDDRMKVSNEILNGIKYIKMGGWEEFFLKKVKIDLNLTKRYLSHLGLQCKTIRT